MPPKTKKVSSIGIMISFLAGFLTIIINYLFFYINKSSSFFMFDFEEHSYDLWIVLLLAFITLKHHSRIIFLDSSISENLQKSKLKSAIFILIPTVIIGGLTSFFFGINLILGSIFMVFYVLLYGVFWIQVIGSYDQKHYLGDIKNLSERQIENKIKQFKTQKGKCISALFSDASCIAFWGLFIQAKLNHRTLEESEGIMILLMLNMIFHTIEFFTLHKTPFFERVRSTIDTVKHLNA